VDKRTSRQSVIARANFTVNYVDIIDRESGVVVMRKTFNVTTTPGGLRALCGQYVQEYIEAKSREDNIVIGEVSSE